MKVCSNCGFKVQEDNVYCPQCGNKVADINGVYSTVFHQNNKQLTLKNSNSTFPFIVKMVVGIIGILSFRFYILARIECFLFGIIASIFSLSTCKWNNKISAFVPAILYFFASCCFNGHILVQLICIIYMILEIIAGCKIKKK